MAFQWGQNAKFIRLLNASVEQAFALPFRANRGCASKAEEMPLLAFTVMIGSEGEREGPFYTGVQEPKGLSLPQGTSLVDSLYR